jgi:hypothetical protein
MNSDIATPVLGIQQHLCGQDTLPRSHVKRRLSTVLLPQNLSSGCGERQIAAGRGAIETSAYLSSTAGFVGCAEVSTQV